MDNCELLFQLNDANYSYVTPINLAVWRQQRALVGDATFIIIFFVLIIITTSALINSNTK